MSRYTVATLRTAIAKINDSLLREGSDTLLDQGGRNGYQAVDEYSVDSDGNRIGSGITRNICCGTSRECGDAAWSYYDTKVNQMENKVKFADAVVNWLRAGCRDVDHIYCLAEAAGLLDSGGL